MGNGNEMIMFLIGLGILLVFFLVCREFLCWYWKINKSVELLEEQNKILLRIEKGLLKDRVW
jgi:hypothetical protein